MQAKPSKDLTFSAPKSVSIMALVFEDNRLIEAHSQAVKDTLDEIEKNFLKVFLCFILPQYGNTFNDGQNFLNYCCQLKSVLLGAMIKKGPHIFLLWDTWASRAMACIVLPSPISSASIPLMPC